MSSVVFEYEAFDQSNSYRTYDQTITFHEDRTTSDSLISLAPDRVIR